MHHSRSLRSGPEPDVQHCERPEDEQRVILDVIRRWMDSTAPEDICLGARTNDLVSRYAEILEHAGIAKVLVRGASPPDRPGVRLATMHRMKGLEFKKVLLCGVQDGQVPLALPEASFADEASQADHDRQEQCLFYVASTRARDELVVTGFGNPSRFTR